MNNAGYPMPVIVSVILDLWQIIFLWVAAFAIGFSLLARICACNPGQSLWRKDALTDLIYCFVMPILTRIVQVGMLGGGVWLLYGKPMASVHEYIATGFGPAATMPVWLQAAVIFLVADVLLYWLHRWFHRKPMWRFHAIHHSSPQVDWLSTYRFHPINTWLSFTLVDSLMLLAGFAPAAIAAMAGFNTLYSAMVHANLNWTFGPFKYLFASPVFHRWHHTAQEEGMDKNFAPTFPLLDIAFGTFYMPEDRLPQRYGVPGSNIPNGFIGQILWPFKKQD